MPRCEGDCDLDWLGNDMYNKRYAENNVYDLSHGTYLLTHENAPLGAYGGGEVILFLVTFKGQSIHFSPLLTEQGEPIAGDRRGWFYQPEHKLIGYSPTTNSVGQCGRTYFYTLSSNKLKLKHIGVHKEMLQMAECQDVKKELSAYPPSVTIMEQQ